MSTQPPPRMLPALKESRLDFNLMVGQLDRSLSEFLHACEDPGLDKVNAHTLKHHADDLIGVGQHALKKLAERGET